MKITSLFLSLVLTATMAFAATEYPLRAKFPDAPPISTEDLKKLVETGKPLIVDVRSEFEFNTVHINNSLNLPISGVDYANKFESVKPKDPATPVVFYCNGILWPKSYEAAVAAIKVGHKLSYVYDDGIIEWLKTNPEFTTLVGKTPADPTKMIPDEKFKAKCVDLEKFKQMAKEPGTIVVDIRDPDQRKDKFEIENARNIPLDRIEPFLNSPQAKQARVLVFDMSGKRVDWLMYHMEDKGITNYYFLDGGVTKNTKK